MSRISTFLALFSSPTRAQRAARSRAGGRVVVGVVASARVLFNGPPRVVSSLAMQPGRPGRDRTAAGPVVVCPGGAGGVLPNLNFDTGRARRVRAVDRVPRADRPPIFSSLYILRDDISSWCKESAQ